jgi:TolB protein
MRPLLTLAATLVLALSGWTALRSQERTLTGGISETGLRRVPIALPMFSALPEAGARALAQEVTVTLRSDLEASGYFTVVPPDHYRLVPAAEGDAVRFEEWQSLGSESLVLGEVSADGERYRVDAKLYDPAGKQMIMGRRYRGTQQLGRQIAHRLADEIVLHYTGRRGMAQSKIAFVARVGEAKEVFLMDYDGRRVRKLTANGTLNLSPTWSPDGERICITSYMHLHPALFLLDKEGGIRKLELPGSALNISPAWSPDSTTMAYSASQNGNTDIYLLDIEQGGSRRLTSHRSIDCCPSWSPTGRELAFTSDRSGRPQLYVMDAEGANVRRLTYQGRFNDSAAWSPQGDRIAFVSRAGGWLHLHRLDLATREVTQLTFGRSNNESPSWSPDGRHLVFQSNRTGAYDIYRIPAGGGEPVRLTRTEGASAPAWSR